MTIVEALKKVVKAYDGAESKANTTVDALEDIVVAMGGTPSGGNTVQQVIEDIAATIEAGGGGGITPTGKINITTTAEVDVTPYATAQVSDENLTAANIKKDVFVLGITGEYEGGGGGFMGMQTATITCNFTLPELEGTYTIVDIAPTWTIEYSNLYDNYQDIQGTVFSGSTSDCYVPFIPEKTNNITYLEVVVLDPEENPIMFYFQFNAASYTGGVSYNSETGYIEVTGDGSITATLVMPD